MGGSTQLGLRWTRPDRQWSSSLVVVGSVVGRVGTMPVFGARMVCETANYKYIEERDKKFAQREESLGE